MPKIDAKFEPRLGSWRDRGGFVAALGGFLFGWTGWLLCGVVSGLAMIGALPVWWGFRSSMVSFPRQRGEGFDINGEFDPGSGRTLAACLTHASRTDCSGLALGG